MALGPLLFILFTVGVVFLLLSRHLHRESGLPSGEIIYEDTGKENTRVLTSYRYGLRGKPDYLLEDRAGGIIPVELKSGQMPRGRKPHRSHVMQLAVYFILVEDNLRRDVHYGLIRYRNGEVQIENTVELRDELLSVVEEMRSAIQGNVHRSHIEVGRCRACSMGHTCDERLT